MTQGRAELLDIGRGVRLHVRHWGEAGDDTRPHLLVHGLASNSRLWDGVVTIWHAARGMPDFL